MKTGTPTAITPSMNPVELTVRNYSEQGLMTLSGVQTTFKKFADIGNSAPSLQAILLAVAIRNKMNGDESPNKWLTKTLSISKANASYMLNVGQWLEKYNNGNPLKDKDGFIFPFTIIRRMAQKPLDELDPYIKDGTFNASMTVSKFNSTWEKTFPTVVAEVNSVETTAETETTTTETADTETTNLPPISCIVSYADPTISASAYSKKKDLNELFAAIMPDIAKHIGESEFVFTVKITRE